MSKNMPETHADGMLAWTHPTAPIPNPRRTGYLLISASALLDMMLRMNGRKRFAVQGIPEDAEFVGVTLDPYHPNTVLLWFESDAFDTPEGGRIPEISPLVREIHP